MKYKKFIPYRDSGDALRVGPDYEPVDVEESGNSIIIRTSGTVLTKHANGDWTLKNKDGEILLEIKNDIEATSTE